MPLAAGTKIGRYVISSPLGKGGMGEVYLARETKLDRNVALKILPPELAINRDRMVRFIQEAKAAAALNHPHVAHVYEIGEHEGLTKTNIPSIIGFSLNVFFQAIEHKNIMICRYYINALRLIPILFPFPLQLTHKISGQFRFCITRPLGTMLVHLIQIKFDLA
jgi:serine/threonine protein kinase